MTICPQEVEVVKPSIGWSEGLGRTWRRPDADWTDRVRMTRQPDGWTIKGQIVSAGGSDWLSTPFRGWYHIVTDTRWQPRTASLRLVIPDGPLHVNLHRDGSGVWSSGDHNVISGLEDCLDVDLYVTPATNTLAVRRLTLPMGRLADLVAALVAPDDLIRRWHVRASRQPYERITAATYRFVSFDETGKLDRGCELEIDPDGLLRSYGDHWRTIGDDRNGW